MAACFWRSLLHELYIVWRGGDVTGCNLLAAALLPILNCHVSIRWGGETWEGQGEEEGLRWILSVRCLRNWIENPGDWPYVTLQGSLRNGHKVSLESSKNPKASAKILNHVKMIHWMRKHPSKSYQCFCNWTSVWIIPVKNFKEKKKKKKDRINSPKISSITIPGRIPKNPSESWIDPCHEDKYIKASWWI